MGIDGQFEKVKIRYTVPEKEHTYTVDFLLPNGIHIESKGRFLSKDRKKHLLIKAQHPEIELRFVFTNPQAKISKASDTTYAMWAEARGFKYSKGSVPQTWIDEPAL